MWALKGKYKVPRRGVQSHRWQLGYLQRANIYVSSSDFAIPQCYQREDSFNYLQSLDIMQIASTSAQFSEYVEMSLQIRHNERDGVSTHQPHDCLLNRLFRRRSDKTSKLHATGLCAGNSPVTGEFFTQRASNAVNVSIWWRHHGQLCS